MSLPILPTISTSFILLSAILIAIGWGLIKQRKIDAHKKTMTAAGISGIVILHHLCVKNCVYREYVVSGGPENLKIFYTVFLVFHIILATTGAIFGLISIITGYTNKLDRHRKIGPVTSIVWFFVAITGVAVYLLLYVFYSGGPTTSVIKAILNNH